MNLFELFVKIGVDDQASKNISNITSKLGNGLKNAAKIGTAAVGLASAAIVSLTKQAVENFAEYEQLVGGVETLFKDSADTVMQYANNAYKTAGLSANEYMSTVTSFSASLLQSLGGDTEKASKYADQAIIDMADNANKMGTSMEAIQNAYQGFAKQNFTMLDNLKLGYGGTKEEMQRLLDDASKISGIKYDISSFADITEAIHVMQTEMGIAGTTALEASSTISGSIGSMKASWSNLITGIADDNADFDVLVSNFVDSVSTASENILPRIEVALNGVGNLIDSLFPIIIEKLPSIIESVLPKLADSALKIIESLITSLSTNSQQLVDVAFTVINTLVNGIVKLLPQLLKLGLDLIVSIALGLAKNVKELIPPLIEAVLTIVNTLTDPDTLSQLLDAALVLILALVEGLLSEESINSIMEAIFLLIGNIVTFLTDPQNLAKIASAALTIITSLGSGLVTAVSSIWDKIKEVGQSILDKFGETDWLSIGKNIVEGVKEGIKEKWENLKEWFSSLFGDLTEIAKKILGIASPSKVFKKLGGYTAEGFGIGFADSFADVEDEIQDALDYTDAEYGVASATSSIFSSSGGHGLNSYETQKVNVTVGIDDSANALGLARALLPFLKIAEQEVYA